MFVRLHVSLETFETLLNRKGEDTKRGKLRTWNQDPGEILYDFRGMEKHRLTKTHKFSTRSQIIPYTPF